MKIKIIWIVSFFIPLVLFLSLSFKQPYSNRTTIGNFDPFPDSMHYVVPARNFVTGHGFRLWRPEGETKINVPPLYSLSLIPAYFINSDPRNFYFSNLILGIISLVFLFLISRKLTASPWITGLILLLYAGTYVIYWQPQLAMAENLLMPILLINIWLWLKPLNFTNILFSTFFAVACYGTKYVSLPLTFSILVLLSFRIVYTKRKITKYLTIVILVAIISIILMNGSQLVVNATNLLKSRRNLPVSGDNISWLSLQYFSNSFPKYFSALMGQPIYNLFTVRPILPPYLAVLVLVWCIYSLIKLPKFFWLSIYLIVLIFGQLAFLSVIQMVEGRYAFVFLPLIYTGLAAVLGWLFKTPKIQLLLVSIVAFIYIAVSFSGWKYQLILNFKAAETPWWQIGMTLTDQWMSTKSSDNPILISAMNPFMWDFYRQSRNYQILPYTNTQDFGYSNVWGVNPIPNDWWVYYRAQLTSGRSIYLSTVGFNPNHWKFFETIEQQYLLELIDQECNQSCRLYRLINITVKQ